MSYGILCISDIALGYGSPQIPLFLQSLASHYDTQAYVIETDEPHRPPVKLAGMDRLHVVRSVSAQPYWCLSSHVHRNFEALEIARQHRPEIIVLCSPMQLPFLKKLDYKPKLVIAYLLEIDAEMYMRTLRQYSGLIDRFVFPEYERLRYVLSQLPRPYPKASLFYNVVGRDARTAPKPANERNNAVLYAGTLSSELTFADEFLLAPLKNLPIHIYGNFSGNDAEQLRARFQRFDKSGKGVRYMGYVSSAELREATVSYAYSLVRWNPKAGMNYHYACPNKFFEAIAYGVPPISAPHPQCLEIIKNYECGLLASNFTAKDMANAIQRGMDLLGTSAYDRMVERCRDTYDRFLNWDTQFARFAASLPPKGDVVP